MMISTINNCLTCIASCSISNHIHHSIFLYSPSRGFSSHCHFTKTSSHSDWIEFGWIRYRYGPLARVRSDCWTSTKPYVFVWEIRHRNLWSSWLRSWKCNWSVWWIHGRSKAYSTDDGKEVLLHKIKISLWKEEVVTCFLNALNLVEQYNDNE